MIRRGRNFLPIELLIYTANIQYLCISNLASLFMHCIYDGICTKNTAFLTYKHNLSGIRSLRLPEQVVLQTSIIDVIADIDSFLPTRRNRLCDARFC